MGVNKAVLVDTISIFAFSQLMKQLKLISFATVLLVLASCNGCHKGKSREKPDVSNINIKIHLVRFDQDLQDFRTKDFHQQAEKMREKYGSFFDFYVSQFVIGPRPVGDTTDVTQDAIQKFVTDGYIKRIQDSINEHFKNTADIDEELTQVTKYFKYYFPQTTVPKVVSINSGFSLGAFTYNKDLLGIGLDLYLGANNPDYDSAGIYSYLKHKMGREYIARNSMEVMYNLYFGEQESAQGKTLIEAMVNRGKKMYFLSMVLPDAPDSMIVGYTDNQTRWCEQSEYDIWKFLNDKDLLYKENAMEQKRYLDEGPTTAGMPKEAPGNIGSWIGWQIVNKFMTETGHKISLNDLVTKYDAKTILAKAHYRPSKSVF
jgi:hypothetical protein